MANIAPAKGGDKEWFTIDRQPASVAVSNTNVEHERE